MTARHFKDMPMEQYQAMTDYLSKSMLAVGADCWAKFHHEYGGERQPKKATKSLRLGTAVHTFALEPHLFDSLHYIMPLKEDGKEIVRNETHSAYKEQLAIADGR